MDLRICRRTELRESEGERLLSLWQRVWPEAEFDGETLEERARNYLMQPAVSTDGMELFHMLWDGDRLLGVARTFVREIEFLETRQRIKTLALAGVCSDPNHRGCGSGRRVVQRAFERIGKGGQFCLFQTGVPEFYKKLGARTVENEFVNSLSTEDPTARPWWNDYVMQFGDPSKWQKGRVDLLGAGY